MTVPRPNSLYNKHCVQGQHLTVVSVFDAHDVVATIRVAFIMLYVMLVVEHCDWAWSALLAHFPYFS